MGREALEAAIENYQTGGSKKHQLEGKIVCTCFGVTDKEIERVIKENNLTTVEQVTNFTKAGGGCGGCKPKIQEIIDSIRGQKEKQHVQMPQKGQKLTNIQKISLIERTINEQIRPALRADGGDIELVDVEGKKVIVALRGMCAGCKTAEFTMKDVVEARLREFVCDDIVVEEQKENQ